MHILITGGAGFIGAHIAKSLVERGDTVVLVDNFNDYYDPQLKRDRLKTLLEEGDYVLYEGDVRDEKMIEELFEKEKIDKVVHLAAMAGVRYSLEHPKLYADVNVMGTLNLLEASRKHAVKNFVYASSSSVYGERETIPFKETDFVDNPISPYAATKKSAELLAHVYSHIYKLPTTGLRYFTVYGPWGRPDMAYFKFADLIRNGRSIDIYNEGKMRRNFTFIDDIVSGTLTVLDADLPHAVMNIGNDKDEALMDFITTLEKHLGVEATKNFLPMQPGDVSQTVADISQLRALGWSPTTDIDKGLQYFVDWYRAYFSMEKA